MCQHLTQMQAKEAFGIHDAAYHIGRNELLTWLNDLLQALNFFCRDFLVAGLYMILKYACMIS